MLNQRVAKKPSKVGERELTVGTHPGQAVEGQRGQAPGVSLLTGSRAVQGAASQQASTALFYRQGHPCDGEDPSGYFNLVLLTLWHSLL